MELKYPSVGPIVGQCSSKLSRIFIRGELEWYNHLPRRAHGVVRIKNKSSNSQYSSPIYFKLNPNFDMTGIAILEGLDADTNYEYEIGWIFSDVDTEIINVDQSLDWKNSAKGSFRTASEDPQQSRSIITGSCRYLLKLFGGKFFDDRGDKIFRTIDQLFHDRNLPIHQLIMMGDQIYADDLNRLGADKTVDDYLERYKDAFTQKYIRHLMSKVPTYMTLDDHEIEDNWPANAKSKDLVSKFPAAIHAYQIYQSSHSPCIPVVDGKLQGTLEKLWYNYSDGCVDIFVMDTRTERQLNAKKIISTAQMTALKKWLADGSSSVKVIVSSVPVFGSESHDKWGGFPEQRADLINFIFDHNIPRVVFLSGDLHVSWSSEITLKNNSASKIVSIVASAFFWPYPVGSIKNLEHSKTIKWSDKKEIVIGNASKICKEDNFVHLDFSLSRVLVSIYNRKGELFSQKNHQFLN